MVKIWCPATCANLGSGFDVAGLAVESPFDIVSVEEAPKDGITFSDGFCEAEPSMNSCFPVLEKIRADFKISQKVSITIEKAIPPKSGLGSSAAPAAGTAVGLNELFKLGLSKGQLVEYASLGEAVAGGVAHKDNVAPAITGGVCAFVGENPTRLQRFDAPIGLAIGILRTNVKKESTKFARSVLPPTVTLEQHKYNAAKLALLFSSLARSDARMFAESLDDCIVEPAREKAGILPRLAALKQVCKAHGFGATASGSGPTLMVAGDNGYARIKELEAEIYSLYEGLEPVLSWTKVSAKGCHKS